MSAQHQINPDSYRVVPPERAAERLADLGATPEIFYSSVRAGDTERSRASGVYYPRNYPGTAMWAGTLAQLRRELVKLQEDWEVGQTGNYETVYSSKRKVAFAVVAGDRYAGVDGERQPKLTRRRGPKTKQRVDRNRQRLGQLALDLELSLNERDLPPDEDCQTWFVVVSAAEDEVRIEVSLPRAVGDDGLVSDWVERILLVPVPLSGAVAPIEDEDYGNNDDGDLVTRQ